ncbi:hypothetical protein KUTeg_001055 [Tegillarca granosa]|uniref:Sfi1 spindle body domain-containing protein n=1 Tax=Tegillarca granosa TaxID=220873 RepID=A0ABQ9G0A2_TEGGR|nr:hypothetical protein KUTeg_001055 [Tegillarca granosa]
MKLSKGNHEPINIIGNYRDNKEKNSLKQLQAVAEDHYIKSVMKKVFVAWHLQVKEQVKEKEKLADEMYKYIIMKHYFANWRKGTSA